MSIVNFDEEAKKVKKGKEKRIVIGKDFDIGILEGDGKLHTCGKDEFFYVLKGEGKLLVEDKLFTLKEGEGVLVEAGVKHKRVNPNVYWLCISKHPHKHVFFD